MTAFKPGASPPPVKIPIVPNILQPRMNRNPLNQLHCAETVYNHNGYEQIKKVRLGQ
jgi:hypothetical protein